MSDTTDDGARAAAPRTGTAGLSRRAAGRVLAQVAAGTMVLPAVGAARAPARTGGPEHPPQAGSMTVIAAAQALEGQSARFHLQFGPPGTDTLTVGGTAQDSDFDRPILAALQQEAARYGNTIGVTVSGPQATVTWKQGAPPYLEVALNCRNYHRRDGDRTITYTTSAGAATTTLRNTMPAKNSLADFQADYPGILVIHAGPAKALDATGSSIALPDATKQALKSMPGHSVYVAGALTAGGSWRPVMRLNNGRNSVAFLGALDDGKFGWRLQGSSTLVQRKAALPAGRILSFVVTEWTQNYRVNGGELDFNYDFLEGAQTAEADTLVLGGAPGSVSVLAIVPYALNDWEQQKFASLLAAQAGLPAITPDPLLCDVTSQMPLATYHNACLTTDDVSFNPKGLSYHNHRGCFNRYGAYHTLDQCNGFAPNRDRANLALLQQHGVPDVVARTGDPAGGLAMKVLPCPDAFKPFTTLTEANADASGQYTAGQTAEVAVKGAHHLVCHTDTLGVFAQAGGALITEFQPLAHPELSGYSASWAGATSGWPPEIDINESGVFGGVHTWNGGRAGQPPKFGTYNYFDRKGTQRNSRPYRVPQWPDAPAQLARVFSRDLTRQRQYVDGVAISPWFPLDSTEGWFAWNNTDTVSPGGLGVGKQAPADYADQAVLRSVRYLQYGR